MLRRESSECKLSVTHPGHSTRPICLILSKKETMKQISTPTKLGLMPDFLIIGAGKSGTTSLDNYLRQHPALFMAPVKEPNFFGYELSTEEDFSDDPDELKNYRYSVTDLDSYLHLFEAAEVGQLKGETSNSYLYQADAPARIKHYNPDVKLIAVLRQPAKRLWSRYLHLCRDNRMPSAHFADCLDRNSIWWKRHDLISEGFYFKNLSRFYEAFPASQIRVYLLEELNHSGDQVLQDIFEFLGVDTSVKPRMDVRFNQSGLIKDQWLHKIIGGRGQMQKLAKFLLGPTYKAARKNMLLQKVITRLRNKNLDHPKMDATIERFLLDEVYGEDIRQLQNLLQRDLSSWLR